MCVCMCVCVCERHTLTAWPHASLHAPLLLLCCHGVGVARAGFLGDVQYVVDDGLFVQGGGEGGGLDTLQLIEDFIQL